MCPFIHCDSGNLFMMNSRNEKGEWLQINYQYVEQELKYLTPSSYTSYTHGIWRTKGKVGGDDLGGAGWGGMWRGKTHFKANAPAEWRPNEYWVELNATRDSCDSTAECAEELAEIAARYDAIAGGWVVPFLDGYSSVPDGEYWWNTLEMLATCASMCAIDVADCAAVSCAEGARSKHQPQALLPKWFDMDWEDGDIGAKCVLPIEAASREFDQNPAVGDIHNVDWAECWDEGDAYREHCEIEVTYHGTSRSPSARARAREGEGARRGALRKRAPRGARIGV